MIPREPLLTAVNDLATNAMPNKILTPTNPVFIILYFISLTSDFCANHWPCRSLIYFCVISTDDFAQFARKF